MPSSIPSPGRGRRSAFACLALLAAAAPPGAAQEDAPSAAEIAAQLANPNNSLGSLFFNFDYTSFGGTLPEAGDQSSFVLGFQPVFPYPLGAGLNLFARPLIPIVFDQPVPSGSGFESAGVELGEIGFDLGLGKTLESGWVILGGMVGTLPTATDDRLGKDQFSLGPSTLVAKVGAWGAIGALVTQLWDVAGGEEGVDTNVTGGQYFFTINLQDGWQIGGTPTFGYDHTAAEGQRLTFPLGGGPRKTMILGSTPVRLAGEFWYYIAQADAFGPDWRIRLVVTPVVPLPW